MQHQDEKNIDQQIYELLIDTPLTYAEIGKKVGLSAATVSRRAREFIKKYHFNPSLIKHSGKKPPKQYPKYCHNLQCHQLFYVSAAEAKKNKPFYCSKYCYQPERLPSNSVLKKLYAQTKNIDELSERLRLSYGTIIKLLETYGIEATSFPENVLAKQAIVASSETNRAKPKRTFGSRTRSGFREHLGFTARSSWENNFALTLMHEGVEFDYEPKVFKFPEDRGAKGYLPDFRLQIDGKEIWVEVKGRLMSSDKTKMKRMKKHYPDVFENFKYVSGKPGDPADKFYQSIGMEPYAYHDELCRKYAHKLKFWES